MDKRQRKRERTRVPAPAPAINIHLAALDFATNYRQINLSFGRTRLRAHVEKVVPITEGSE